MQAALDSIITEGSLFDASAATSIKERLAHVGYNYFRLHPKGQGVLCINPDGIQPFTFVEEYFGILHAPWRWFEIQDTLKKYIGEDLPDFYNIVLERPRQDPAGYDVMFVDAASKVRKTWKPLLCSAFKLTFIRSIYFLFKTLVA